MLTPNLDMSKYKDRPELRLYVELHTEEQVFMYMIRRNHQSVDFWKEASMRTTDQSLPRDKRSFQKTFNYLGMPEVVEYMTKNYEITPVA